LGRLQSHIGRDGTLVRIGMGSQMPHESTNLVVMRIDTKEVEQKRGQRTKTNKNGDMFALQTK
jgi:hypothetical protein